MRTWIEKQRYLIDFTVLVSEAKDQERRPVDPLHADVFILASVMFFTYTIKREASIILRASPEIVVQKMLAGRHDAFPAGQIDHLKTIRGVASAEGRLWGYYFDRHVAANYTFLVPPTSALDDTDDPVDAEEPESREFDDSQPDTSLTNVFGTPEASVLMRGIQVISCGGGHFFFHCNYAAIARLDTGLNLCEQNLELLKQRQPEIYQINFDE